jgi:predicted GNAT family acetyltransferase
MAGQRLQPYPYTEVSAVCTHLAYTGKGYGAKLVRSQVCKIIATSRVPFLHVYPENTAARLYEKLGFEVRKQMVVYVLEKV